MKSKIGNGVSVLLCGTVIFSSIFTIGNLKTIFESQNQNTEIHYVKRTPIIKNELLVAKNVYEMQKFESKVVIEEWHPFFELTNKERNTIRYIIAGEAGYESMEGKMAVAQCLLNAMVKEDKRPEEIKRIYKYSGWKTNLKSENAEMWNEVCVAVDKVFDNGEFISENPILFFYAPRYSSGGFHKTLPQDQMIGGHSFHYIVEDKTAEWFTNLKTKNMEAEQHGDV